MGTALLSALMLTIVNLTIYAVPFLAQGPLRFAACGLDGIWEWGTPWFDWSYGTYLLVLVGLLLALSLGAAGLTGHLAAGYALQIPQPGQRRRLAAPGH